MRDRMRYGPRRPPRVRPAVPVGRLNNRHATMKPTAYLTTFLGLPGASDEKRAACNFDLTSRYFYNVSSEESFFQTIDAETTADLDLNAVFERIDRTASKPGQQYLYARLRTLRGTEEVREFGRRTDHFAGNAGHAEQCAKHLSRLSDDDAYDLQNLIFDKPEQVRRIALVYLLSAAAVVSLLLSFLYPLLLLLFLAVFAANMYIHYSNKLNISIYASAVKQLTLALRTARHLAAEEVPGTEEALKVIRQVSEVERRSRVVGTQGDSANELAAAVWLVLELLKAAFNVEVILFHRFIGSIIARRDAIHGLFRFIGETDAAISAARLRGETPTCRPEFTDGKYLRAEEVVHPLHRKLRSQHAGAGRHGAAAHRLQHVGQDHVHPHAGAQRPAGRDARHLLRRGLHGSVHEDLQLDPHLGRHRRRDELLPAGSTDRQTVHRRIAGTGAVSVRPRRTFQGHEHDRTHRRR